jgi:hypothetical protein
MTEHSDRPRSVFLRATLRSFLAVLLGLVAVVLLSLGTNKLVRTLGVFPHGHPAAALVYRSVYIVVGSYIAARFAPSSPMRHALVLGGIEFVLACFSTITLIPMQFMGPAWYYIGSLITALPCAWLGGILHRRFHRRAVSNAA